MNINNEWWFLVPFSYWLACRFAEQGKWSFAMFPIVNPDRKHKQEIDDTDDETEKQSHTKRVRKKSEKRKLLNFVYYLGIDPGVVNCVGVCLHSKEGVLKPKEEKGEERNYYLKSATSEESGKWCNEHIQRFKRNKMMKNMKLLAGRNERNKDQDVAFTAKTSHKYEANLEYIKYRMQFFQGSQREYSRRRVTRLKFDYYIRRRRAIDKLVNELLPSGEDVRTLVCSAVPGSIDMDDEAGRPPEDDTEDIQIIEDEPARPPEESNENRKPRRRGFHRYAVCKTCHIVWNRDINAGRNMIMVATQDDVNYRKSTSQ
ncbi:hypothetical protein ABEB36_007339 [Hypothenemus hampei]|uniref:Uncharacterized protein n=1 Tax=Hypothenemus hampei TaxID=57062 RepID=A0ABD1EVZ8_HYPHA